MVAASIAFQIDVTVGSGVVYEVADFISVRFDDDFIRSIGIDDSDHSAVGVDHVFIDVRPDIIQPHLLATAFKSSWTCVIEVCFEEFLRSLVDAAFLFCHEAKIPVHPTSQRKILRLISTKFHSCVEE